MNSGNPKSRLSLRNVALLAAAGAVFAATVAFAAGPGMGGPGMGGGPAGSSQSDQTSTIEVSVIQPETGNLERQTEFIGKIEPLQSVTVYPDTGGKVTAVYVEPGDTVNAGDLLMEVDSTTAQMNYNLQQASYNSTVANAEKTLGSDMTKTLLNSKTSLLAALRSYNAAKQNYNREYDTKYDEITEITDERDQALLERSDALAKWQQAKQEGADQETLDALWQAYEEADDNLVTINNARQEILEYYDEDTNSVATALANAEDDLEAARELDALNQGLALQETTAVVEAQLAAATLQLEQAAYNLSQTKVYAPISGVVESSNVTLYEPANTSTAVFTISNKSSMQVVFNASSEAAAALSLGDQAVVTKGSSTWPATIVEIDTRADSSTGLFPIKARIDAPSDELLTGVSVKISAATAKAQDALLIPQSLVYYEDNQPYVFTYEDGVAHQTFITTGMSNNDYVQAATGLTADDLVISTWHPDLADGSAVVLKGDSTAQEEQAAPAEQGDPAGTGDGQPAEDPALAEESSAPEGDGQPGEDGSSAGGSQDPAPAEESSAPAGDSQPADGTNTPAEE